MPTVAYSFIISKLLCYCTLCPVKMKFKTILGLCWKIVNYRSTLSPASYLHVKISVNSKNSSLVPGLPVATFMARAPCPSGGQVNIIHILKVNVVIMFVSLKRNF